MSSPVPVPRPTQARVASPLFSLTGLATLAAARWLDTGANGEVPHTGSPHTEESNTGEWVATEKISIVWGGGGGGLSKIQSVICHFKG